MTLGFPIHIAEQARDAAIEWQHGFAEADYSWKDLAAWSGYFTGLAERFPELEDEFRENGII